MKRILLALALFLLPANAGAQGKMDFYRDAVRILEDKLLPRLIDRLPATERNVLRDINIRFVPNPVVVTTVMTEKSSKEIVIFAGFVDGLANYIDCLMLSADEKATARCPRYFSYYFDHVVRKKPGPPIPFAEIILGDEGSTRFFADDKYNRLRQTLLMSALIVITMHEMGHHIEGFASAGMSVTGHRRLEARADKWAIDRLNAMSENPVVGATVALGYLSQMETFRREKGVTSFALHPMPKSRAAYAYEKGCNGVVADGSLPRACTRLRTLIDVFE